LTKKQADFPLSYESDGIMKKKHQQKPSTPKKENKDFFNTTQASE
jgi:hypothetical protein